jgi:REP element-mobilizing transposase RayT
MRTSPVAYFITFHTYGTWLPGDGRGAIDRHHHAYGTPMMPPRPALEAAMRRRLSASPITLDAEQRRVVEAAIVRECRHRGWALHALAVRTEHVHLVVGPTAGLTPERMLNVLKSWATRRMIETGALPPGARAWSRHGSTRHLWTPEAIAAASRYVIDGQGAPLSGGSQGSADP